MDATKMVLLLAAVGEAVTGAALLAVPSLVGRLLLGVELAGVAIPVSRVLGLALVSLAFGCLADSARLGMFIYTALAAFYLTYLGLFTDWVGTLLWPAAAVHAVLTVLIATSAFGRTRLPASA